MNLRWPRFVGCTTVLLLPFVVRAGDHQRINLAPAAWKAWHDGNVSEAAALSDQMSEGPERNHLRFLCSFVSGNYDGALKTYRSIDETYDRLRELDAAVIECYLHLGRYDEACDFAQRRQTGHIDTLRLRAANPLKVMLDHVTQVPFANHKLTPYFPAFGAEVNGKAIIVHVDTGAPFLAMGPDHADLLGIRSIDYGRGLHGHMKVRLKFGIAQRFTLGIAVLENVPVIVFPTLRGKHIIFGTNVLQQFLATLDYPRNRLILSPRADVEERKRHLGMLEGERITVRFHMWGDHYMFARGFVGEDDGLNFFMDSGLVALRQINEEQAVQAGFTSTRKQYGKWGIRTDDVAQRIFQPGVAIGIGPLKQIDLWWLARPSGEKDRARSFGGVRIDGLLAHAFLKAYSWTLDFENRQYIFAQPIKSSLDAAP